MVIDTLDGNTCTDLVGGFGYLKGPQFDGNVTYPNLVYINNLLKQYRSGALAAEEQREPESANYD